MNSFRFRFRSPPTPAEEAQEPRRWCADFDTSRRTSRCQVSVERRAGPRGDDGDAGTPPSDRARRVSSDPHEHARVGTLGTETRADVRAVWGRQHRHRGGVLHGTGARANAALAPIAASRQDRRRRDLLCGSGDYTDLDSNVRPQDSRAVRCHVRVAEVVSTGSLKIIREILFGAFSKSHRHNIR